MRNTRKRASKGETLVETLVAILIITFSAIILVNMTIASTNINRKVESSDTNFREERAAAEGLQKHVDGQITIKGEKTEKIRVAAYCRVSTDKDDQLNSFFAQMRYYRDYVRGNDKMVLVDIYADEGITGTELEKRDEMKRLIRDCKHKKIDRVLVKSVTRFARNSLECIETIRTMQSCGVSVLFENDHIDTETMNSEMMLYIKSAFAQSEATSASKRMSTSIRMKMEDGTYVATSAPFGYRLVDGEYTVVPEEAEVVR